MLAISRLNRSTFGELVHHNLGHHVVHAEFGRGEQVIDLLDRGGVALGPAAHQIVHLIAMPRLLFVGRLDPAHETFPPGRRAQLIMQQRLEDLLEHLGQGGIKQACQTEPPAQVLPAEIDELADPDFFDDIRRLEVARDTGQQVVIVRRVFALQQRRRPAEWQTAQGWAGRRRDRIGLLWTWSLLPTN